MDRNGQPSTGLSESPSNEINDVNRANQALHDSRLHSTKEAVKARNNHLSQKKVYAKGFTSRKGRPQRYPDRRRHSRRRAKLVRVLGSCGVLVIWCWLWSRYEYQIFSSESFLLALQQEPSPQLSISVSSPQSYNNPVFPKILHFLWPNTNFTYSDDGKESHVDKNSTTKAFAVEEMATQHRIQRLVEMHPDWKLRIWTDDDCHALLQERFPDFYQRTWAKLRPKLKQWDAIRPLILYEYGGIYLDHDVDCPSSLGPSFLDRWISSRHLSKHPQDHSRKTPITLLLRQPQPEQNQIGNHFMGSIPKHPLWEYYRNEIGRAQGRDATWEVTRHTGPQALYRVFSQYMQERGNATESLKEGTSIDGTIRYLELNELSNGDGECQRVARLQWRQQTMKQHQSGSYTRSVYVQTFCNTSSMCLHRRSVSPAEIQGEDDNAEFQLRLSREKNRAYQESLQNASLSS